MGEEAGGVHPPKISLPGPASGGFMTLEELGWKLQDLEETRKLAQAELAVLEVRGSAWRS